MRNWTGLVFLVVGAWLLYAGLVHRGRTLARLRRDPPIRPQPEAVPNEFALGMFGGIVRSIIFFALAYLAVKVSIAYAWLGGARMFSFFDLVSFLFLLGAYGVWVSLKTKYRVVGERSAAALPPDHSENAEITSAVVAAAPGTVSAPQARNIEERAVPAET